MSKIAVVTDSTSCIPKELIKKYNIKVVPFHIHFEDKTYLDDVDLKSADFYKMQKEVKESGGTIPTTASATTGSWLTAYQEASTKVDGIASIVLSSSLSPAHQWAKQAAEEMSPLPVEVVDCRTTGGALGFIALAAARAAEAGKSLAEVAQAAKDMMPRVNLLIMVETLYYFAKGGRIGKAQAWAGSLLNMKPILEIPVSQGIVCPVERVRTKLKGVERMIEIMAQRVGDAKPVHVIVHCANDVSEGEELKAKVVSRFDCAESYVVPLTPVMGAHIGPALGLSFFAGEY